MRCIDWLEEKNIYYKILYIFYAIISVTCIKEIPYIINVLSKIMIIISFIYFCVFTIKGYYFKLPKVKYIMAIFIILQLSSFFVSKNYIYDFTSLVVNTIYFFIISINVKKSSDDINVIFKWIINTIFPIISISLITYYFKIKFTINETIYGKLDSYEGANKTFIGVTVNVNTLGILCAILIMLSIHLLITKKQTIYMKIYLYINVIIGVIALVNTKARGAMLMLGAYLVCMVILFIKNKIVAISMIVIPTLTGMAILYKLILVDGFQALSTGRSLLWVTAAKVIKENPVFGVGTTAFVDVIKNSSSVHLPGIEFGGLHNIYIQIAAANGCISLLVFIIFIFTIIILGIKGFKIEKISNNKMGISLLAIISSFLALGFVESSLMYVTSFIALIFWVCIGYFIDMLEDK